MLNNTMKKIIDEIDEQEKNFGGNIFERTKRTDEDDINHFEHWLSKYSKADMHEYIDFVKYLNGLNFNGLFIYSLDEHCDYDIYESNETRWENEEQKEYIFLGDDSISWYCLDKNTGKYFILDKPSGDIMEEYKTYHEMMIKALKNCLG